MVLDKNSRIWNEIKNHEELVALNSRQTGLLHRLGLKKTKQKKKKWISMDQQT